VRKIPDPGSRIPRKFQVQTAHTRRPPSPPGHKHFRRFIAAIEALSGPVQYAIVAILIATIFALDYITGPEVAFSIFYLIPVSLLAWSRGFVPACIGVLVCGLAWLTADTLNAHEYSHRAIQYWNASVRTSFFFVVAYILVQLRRAVDEEQRLARTDDLTGAANGRWFFEVAAAEIARQRRYHHPLSILFLDCDNFKTVNDQFGHAAGDDLLKRIAVSIQGALREVDLVARLGGDEFAVLLPESDGRAADHVTSKVSKALGMAVVDHKVTFSVGVVTYYEPPDDVETLVDSADQVMYEAKNAGKNAVRHRIIGSDMPRTAEGP
jgi:diguanylate cyclase (GGDEF)-like protein